MSFTMIISSKLAPGTMLATGVGSTPTPEKISSYISATRRGVSRTPSRSGSSPIPSRIRRTPSSTFLRSTSFTAIPTLPRYESVQRVGQVAEVRELGGERKLGALSEPIDPHGSQAEVHRDANQRQRGGEHVGVGVRENRQPPSTLP